MIKNDKKVIRAWCFYDWANSAYSLVIISSIFPAYYQAVTSANNGIVSFLGFKITNTVLYSYSLSFSFLLIALLSPLLTAIADYTGKKKAFMKFFCVFGSLCCAALFLFTKDTIALSIFAFIGASIGYSGSIVFYNAFLPEITTEENYDKVSASGFAYGYIGSIILLVINLSMILFPQLYGGISKSLASRISFLSVGIWWLGFAFYTFRYLPSNVYKRESTGNWMLNGFHEFGKVWKEVAQITLLKRFLISFFFYSMGTQTIMYLATIFGEKELKLETDKLIITVLILQLVAIPGAKFFAGLSGKKGNIFALSLAVIIWIGICVSAYFVYSANSFYLLAGAVGIVMGGIQSLSRATYSKLIPEETIDHASYFSFYDIAEKMSIVLGTFFYGIIEHVSGSMRNSTLVLAIFFIIGLLFLVRIPSLKNYHLKK